MKRVVAVLLTGVALALLPASPALAHPLGNFTVNTADQVVLTSDGVEVLHVVDLAEIPTVQLRSKVSAAGGLAAYAVLSAALATSAFAAVDPRTVPTQLPPAWQTKTRVCGGRARMRRPPCSRDRA